MRTAFGFVALIVIAIAAPAMADSWAAPQVTQVFSASRDHFARITPGKSIGDTFGFAAPKGSYAQAEFYTRQPDRSYRLMHGATLLNPVAPVRFFDSDHGRLATLDNWHNAGFSKTVAIFESGRLVKAYELADSVSSIHGHANALVAHTLAEDKG